MSFFRTATTILFSIGFFFTASSVVLAIDKPIHINSFERTMSQEPSVATKKIMSESGSSFTIPYIQTNDAITASVKSTKNMPQKVIFVLSENGRVIEERIVASPYKTVFHNIKKGEYTLDAHGLDAEGKILKDEKFHDKVTHIGIGDIIIAIGDSTTEGYFLYKSQFPTWLSAPADYTSLDRRTYPQPGGMATFPTKAWLPELSTYLTEMYGYPVFIKNAGYSEITTGEYLALMRTKEWQKRQHSLQPNKWLIQLGVNDGLFHVTPQKYKENLQNIITILQTDYDAQIKNIFLAKPTYTIGMNRTEKLIPIIDELWEKQSVAKGPDLWNYFSTRHIFYKDQFHPNEQGMKEEAKLWHRAFVDQESIAVTFPFYTRYYIENTSEYIQKKIIAKIEKIKVLLQHYTIQ